MMIKVKPRVRDPTPFLALTEPVHGDSSSKAISLLPDSDIGNARHVAKKSQNTIGESGDLGRQRFLVADEKSRGRPIYPWVHGSDIVFTGHFRPPGDADGIEEQHYPECYIARPVVQLHPKLKGIDETDGGPTTSIKVTFASTPKDILTWEDCKWHEEFLTQPPRKEIRIQITDDDPQEMVFGSYLKQPTHKYLDVADEEGVRWDKGVEGLREMVYSPRAKKTGKKRCPKGKVVRTRFSLERYKTLSFDIPNFENEEANA